MLISTRSRYALRVLARMTNMLSDGNTEPVSLALLSKQEEVSMRYLEQIFGLLRRHGIVIGKRGPGGGYVLGKPSEQISLFEIFDILETDFLPATCMIGDSACSPRAGYNPHSCPLEENCVTKPLWMDLREMFYSHMRDRSLKDLAEGNI